MKKVNILYSGGWDGTFRMIQLAQFDIVIQPIYIIDIKRGSTEYEKSAINKIIAILNENYKAVILPVKIYEKEWILENCKSNQISESFKYLREKYKVGKQYEWFALLARYLNTTMEASVVHQYHGKVEDAIDAEGILTEECDDVLGIRYRVLPKGTNVNAANVFENLILPVIKLSKEDEKRIAEEQGWIDIIKLSWFCHTPINGEPCGLCGPCDDAMNTGMEWRVPKSAQIRYRHKTFFKIMRKLGFNI